MKTRILVLALVLVGWMAPSPSAARYPFCPDCSAFEMGPNAKCTCPGAGPFWIVTTCGAYPFGCQPPVERSSDRDLDTFLGALAVQPEAAAGVR